MLVAIVVKKGSFLTDMPAYMSIAILIWRLLFHDVQFCNFSKRGPSKLLHSHTRRLIIKLGKVFWTLRWSYNIGIMITNYSAASAPQKRYSTLVLYYKHPQQCPSLSRYDNNRHTCIIIYGTQANLRMCFTQTFDGSKTVLQTEH